MHEIVFHKTASKKLLKLPKDFKNRIIKSVELLSINPYIGKKLSGSLEGCYRIRVGDFRIIYDIQQNTIIILTIGSRGDVYK